MQFSFTEEQEQFRDIVARFCRERSPTSAVRQLMTSDTGFDPGIWRQLCQELGVVGIHLPEERGGAGFGPIELGIVMEEFGRALLPAPYLASGVLAPTAIAAIDDAAIRDSLLGPIASGERIATLALDHRHGDPLPQVDEEDAHLSGTLRGVLDAGTADTLLVLTPNGDGATLWSMDAGTGYEVRALNTMDSTRRLYDVTLNKTPATALGQLDSTQLKSLYDVAIIALANESAGVAQALLEAALDYTKIRVQFGRAVGSFQAIKHRLADLHVDVELAKVAAWQAAAALASGEEPSANASLAKFTTAETAIQAALECIQLHGGIGFTWENDTHLWYRRAKSSEVFLGSPAWHRERMLKEMNV